MSAMDVLRSFAEAREPDSAPVPGITYGHAREIYTRLVIAYGLPSAWRGRARSLEDESSRPGWNAETRARCSAVARTLRELAEELEAVLP